MSTEKELKFNEEMIQHQKNVKAVTENIAKAKRVLASGEYKLARLKEEELNIYKTYGIKAPTKLVNPELAKIKEVALMSKHLLNDTLNETVGFLNQKGMDKEFFQAKYQEYKTLCIEKGIQFKSRDEVQNILSSIKNFQEEIKEVSLYDIINKVSKEAEEKTNKIRRTLKEYDFASKIDYVVLKFFPPKTEGYSSDEKKKYLLFFQWIQTINKELYENEENYTSIYLAYTEYVNKHCTKDECKVMTFSLANDEFLNAINQYRNIEVKLHEDEQLGI